MTGVVGFASDPGVIWSLYPELTGTRAFDIGANGGMTARILAAGFTQVHAFEPAVESYDHLCSGLPDNVWPHQLAVSDHNGTVYLDERTDAAALGELTSGGSMAGSWGERTGRREVRCQTVDSLAAEHGDPDFIKVDTEGHERAVIEGALGTVARCDPRLLIEVHDAAQGEWIVQALGGRVAQVRHPSYAPGSDLFANHYFLLRGLG